MTMAKTPSDTTSTTTEFEETGSVEPDFEDESEVEDYEFTDAFSKLVAGMLKSGFVLGDE